MTTPARKHCLVTGGSRGIGLGIVRRLNAEGYRLAATAQNEERETVLRRQLEALQAHDFLTLVCNVGIPEQVDAMFERMDREFGELDAVVVNAGIHHAAPAVDIEAVEWDRMFAIDVRGAMLCCRNAARRMVDRGGNIVIIGSIAGERAVAKRSCYCAAKAAIHTYAQSVAQEWAPLGIRVNIVAPGPIGTEFLYDALREPSLDSLKGREGLTKRVPLGRIGTVEDVAAAVYFLISNEAAFITGELLRVDGGRIWS